MSSLRINEIKNVDDDGASENLIPSKIAAETNYKNGNIKEAFIEAIPFSEALDRTKYGKFNYFIIIITGLVLANVLLETSSVAFFMPVAECDLKLTNYRKGLLSAIGYIGMIVSSHLWGFLADTKGRKRVIRPTLFIGFLVTVISSFSTEFWTMLILRFINGIFISGASATIYAYVSEFHSDRTRDRAMMISSFIFALGAMFMPFLSFAVINREWRYAIPLLGIVYKPWRLFVIVCGLPGFFCGIAMCFLPESPKFLLSIDKEEKAKAVLQKIYRMNGGKDKLELPKLLPEETSCAVPCSPGTRSKNLLGFFMKMWDQTRPLFTRNYLRSTLIVCTTQFWLFFITNGLYMWFPYIVNAMGEYMNSQPGENQRMCEIVYEKHDYLLKRASNSSNLVECLDKLENTTFMYSLLLEILYVSSFATITVIINRVGKITIMFLMIVLCSACGIVAVLLPYPSIAAVFYVILFVCGVAINILGAVTVDLYPTQLRAMSMCISLMLGRIGSVLGTIFVGALLSDHCEMTFYVSTLAMMTCAILLLFLPRSITVQRTESNQGQI